MKKENVDCEVYKKPNVKTFISQDMGTLLRSNHNDLLGGGGGENFMLNVLGCHEKGIAQWLERRTRD